VGRGRRGSDGGRAPPAVQPAIDRNQTIATITRINKALSEAMRRISPPSRARLGAAGEHLHIIFRAAL